MASEEEELEFHTPMGTPTKSPKDSPNTLRIAVGSQIRIRTADRIHHKLLAYADTPATVVEMPVHPNTWYGVRLWDQRRVKIRKSAFDVGELSLSEQEQQQEQQEQQQQQTPSKPQRQRSRPQHIVSPTKNIADGIYPGIEVTIISNNDVLQKFPRLVGQTGQIVEIPTHPNTWFTVRLQDTGRIVKMRRSALQFPFDSAQDPPADLLRRPRISSADWVGAEVVITKGRGHRQQGVVVAVRNNKLRVELESMQQILKKVGQVQRLYEESPRKQRRGPSPVHLVGSFVSIEQGERKGEIGFVVGKESGMYVVELSKRALSSQDESSSVRVLKNGYELKILASVGDDETLQGMYERVHWIGQEVRVRDGEFQGMCGTIRGFGEGSFHVSLQGVESEQYLQATDLELRFPEEPGDQQQWTAASVLIDLMGRSDNFVPPVVLGDSLDSSKPLLDSAKPLLDSAKHLPDPAKPLLDPAKPLMDSAQPLIASSDLFSSAIAAYKRSMGPLKEQPSKTSTTSSVVDSTQMVEQQQQDLDKPTTTTTTTTLPASIQSLVQDL